MISAGRLPPPHPPLPGRKSAPPPPASVAPGAAVLPPPPVWPGAGLPMPPVPQALPPAPEVPPPPAVDIPMAQPAVFPMALPYHPPPPPAAAPPVPAPTAAPNALTVHQLQLPTTPLVLRRPFPSSLRLTLLGNCQPWLHGFRLIFTVPMANASGRWAGLSMANTPYDPIGLAEMPPEVRPPPLATPSPIRYIVLARRVVTAADAMSALTAIYACGACPTCRANPRPAAVSVDYAVYTGDLIWARLCAARWHTHALLLSSSFGPLATQCAYPHILGHTTTQHSSFPLTCRHSRSPTPPQFYLVGRLLGQLHRQLTTPTSPLASSRLLASVFPLPTGTLPSPFLLNNNSKSGPCTTQFVCLPIFESTADTSPGAASLSHPVSLPRPVSPLSSPVLLCNEELTGTASPVPPIFQRPFSLPTELSFPPPNQRKIWHITSTTNPCCMPARFRLFVTPNRLIIHNARSPSPSTPSTTLHDTPPVSPQLSWSTPFSPVMVVLPAPCETTGSSCSLDQFFTSSNLSWMPPAPLLLPAPTTNSSSTTARPTPPVSPQQHWSTVAPRLAWISPPSSSLILSVISDTDRESDDGWHDLAEFQALDLPYARERYYADLALHLPARATRAQDVLYFVPPWPEHRAHVRRAAEHAYPSEETAHAAAAQALRDAYLTTAQAPPELWDTYFQAHARAERALLQATDLRSLDWPLHSFVKEPRAPFHDESRAHHNARLLWQRLSTTDREWLMNHLPTLAMIISESQRCYINIDSYRTAPSPPVLPLNASITTPPTSPRSPTLSFSEMMAVQNSTSPTPSLSHPAKEGPDHMYKSFLLDDVPSMILVDTGATASLVRMSHLTPTQQSRVSQPPEPIKLLGASGHRIDILGQIPMTISRDGVSIVHMFAVCNDSLPTAIILGLDFLRLHVHVIYPDTGRVVMKGSNSKSIGPPLTLPPAQQTKPLVPPTRPLVAHLPSLFVKSGEAVPVFIALPHNDEWQHAQLGDTVLVEPIDALTADTGLCALPICQTVSLHNGLLGVFYLVANPSKADVRNPNRSHPRAATITKIQHEQLDRSDDYLMQPAYQAWFVNAAGLPPSALDSFQELYGRGRIALDTNISEGHWWINPPWNQLHTAMLKIQSDRPESFLIFGPSAKSTPWITLARQWGLKELKPPRTLGTPGYFLLRNFDNTLKPVPFPQHWDLIAFYGTRSQIPLAEPTPEVLSASVHPEDGPHTAVHFDTEHLSSEELLAAKDLAFEFRDLFKTDDYPVVPDYEMDIDTGSAPPAYVRPGRYSPAAIAAENDGIQQMLSLNVIEPGFGAWASRRIQVKKPDGTWRHCVDFRYVNSVTPTQRYALPRIDDILDHLKGAQFISTSDMWKGFWQVSIKESDRHKTGFLTRQGLYQFRVMPFGLKNAPAIFQRLMDTTLAGLLWVTCLCYIDDLICFGPSFSASMQNLREALQRLRTRNLRLRADKCYWFFKEVRLLGHIVSGTAQRPDPAKIEAITSMTPPTSKEEVASFLGLTGWYQRFIPKYATIAAPLFDLKRTNSTFVWSATEHTAWSNLKEAMTSPGVVLAQPNPDKPYQLETDASYIAVGGVLQQQDDNNEWRPVMYLSRRLAKAERNYAPTELECLGVLYCVEKCRCYVLGRHFTILTDHRALQWLLKSTAHEGRLARWALRLQEFDFTIKHRAGTLQVVADALSRLPTTQNTPSIPFKDHVDSSVVLPCLSATTTLGQCLLPTCSRPVDIGTNYSYCSFGCRKSAALLAARQALFSKFHDSSLALPVVPNVPSQLNRPLLPIPSIADIVTAQKAAPELQLWWSFLTHGHRPSPGHPQRRLFFQYFTNISIHPDERLVFKQNPDALALTVVPASLRPLFLHFFHDLPTSGHFGRQKTLHNLQQHCWWPSIVSDVDQYVRSCICRRTQQKTLPSHTAALTPISPIAPNEMVAGDVAGPFPSSDGYRYVLVLTCLFSRYTRLFALTSTSAIEAAEAFYHGWVLLFGPPRRFLSDRGPQFTAELLVHLCKLIGVDKVFTTPYHPQGDGAAERRFRTLTNSINACWHANMPWPPILDSIAYAYNNSYNRMIDTIPFMVFLGRLPTGLSALEQDDGQGSPEILNARAYGRMAYTRLLQEAQVTHDHVTKAQDAMARDHDKRSSLVSFRLHDLVWLFTPRLEPIAAADHEEPASSKLQNFWGTTPWVITALHPPANATISNIHGLSQRVHFSRLRAYVSPLTDAIDTGADGRPVIIHHVIGIRRYGSTVTYKVRWFPFNIKPDSNVPAHAVPMRLILDFQDKQQNPVSDLCCDICQSPDNARDMLLCDGCDHGFHNPCLNRTPGDIPAGDWFCPSCTPLVAPALSSH